MWKNWVLDVTHGHDPMAFCPIEDDGTIITGMTMISGKCPGRFVGVFHFDGEDAANEWLANHSAVAEELAAANPTPTPHSPHNAPCASGVEDEAGSA